ncbi:hypothetical protein LOAG_15495, partial [Loa loa]
MTLRILFTLPGMVLVFQHASVNLSTFLEAGVRFRLSSLFDRVRRCPLITASLRVEQAILSLEKAAWSFRMLPSKIVIFEVNFDQCSEPPACREGIACANWPLSWISVEVICSQSIVGTSRGILHVGYRGELE